MRNWAPSIIGRVFLGPRGERSRVVLVVEMVGVPSGERVVRGVRREEDGRVIVRFWGKERVMLPLNLCILVSQADKGG